MKWISKINRVPQVAEMSANLADILRFCISPEEFVALRREVEILERYVEIQEIRMSGAFTFRVSLPEELAECRIPQDDSPAHCGKCRCPWAGEPQERNS